LEACRAALRCYQDKAVAIRDLHQRDCPPLTGFRACHLSQQDRHSCESIHHPPTRQLVNNDINPGQ
jgi:hypothetical protein